MKLNKSPEKHKLDHHYKHLFEQKWFELESIKKTEANNAVHPSKSGDNQFRQASLLRDIGALNFRKSIQQNHPSITTCYQLASDVERYEQAVVHRTVDGQSTHLYLDDCLAMLKIAEPGYSLRDWRTAVGKHEPTFTRHSDEEYQGLRCRGAHLECQADELQPEQLRRMLDLDDPAGQEKESSTDSSIPHDNQMSVEFATCAATQFQFNQNANKLTDLQQPRGRDSAHASGLPQISRAATVPGSSKWLDYCVQDEDKPFADSQIPPTPADPWPQRSQQPSSTPPDYGSKRSRPDNSNIRPTIPEAEDEALNDFRTASEVLLAQQNRPAHTATAANGAPLTASASTSTIARQCKRLGLQRKPPPKPATPPPSTTQSSQEPEDERLRHIEPQLVERIRSEIMDTSGAAAVVQWDDIAGLQFAKQTIIEAVVYPMLRPDLFSGLRRPPRGILLFGPPGTGKTLIGKCIAAHSKATFFSISASSLTSKWIGEGEKMVRALFAVAGIHSPSVIFIDEIDSMLTQRSDSEHESSRRLKTEFLVQLDGVASNEAERILVVGATNRPQELDEAARRRLVKRLYIPLPDRAARVEILRNLLRQTRHSLDAGQIGAVAELTAGYSGADMRCLGQEAAMFPLRALRGSQLEQIELAAIPALRYEDFVEACGRVRPSVSPADLEQYEQWDGQYGSGGFGK